MGASLRGIIGMQILNMLHSCLNLFLSRKFARELGRRGLDMAHQAKSIFTFKNLLALD